MKRIKVAMVLPYFGKGGAEIKICACDQDLIDGMKRGSIYHRCDYDIDTYIDNIISCLRY